MLQAHDVRWFLYNGGNDSADTALKVSHARRRVRLSLTCIGVPKTIDNDLAVTDCCPGFGSAARYTAVSVRECALDVAAMADTSTKVFVYEAMGRNAGWLSASAGLAGRGEDEAPHLILFPERPYDEADFLARVEAVVDRVGHCIVVASEGLRYADGRHVADAGAGKDAFGHTQLGGVSSFLAGRVKHAMGLKVHWTMPDYLQRSARHLASATMSSRRRRSAASRSTSRSPARNATMPVMRRTSSAPCAGTSTRRRSRRSPTGEEAAACLCPRRRLWYRPAARRYLEPLIQGDAPPPWRRDGLPAYVELKNAGVPHRLPAWLG